MPGSRRSPPAPKDQTTLPEQCAQEDSPKAEKLDWRKLPRPYRRRGKYAQANVDWSQVKVFEEPVFRLPYKLSKYTKGKNGAPEPDAWIQAGIESGLIVMDPDAPRNGGFLEAIDGGDPPTMTKEELEALIAKGIADLVEDQ